MKTACHLIAVAAKLAARVQDGVYNLEGGLARLRVNVHRDASPVVLNGHCSIRVNGYGNVVAEACQSLIDGVVHNLKHQVMQPADVGAANVHPRPTPDRLEPFQHLDVFGSVSGLGATIRHVGSRWLDAPTGAPCQATYLSR